MTFDRDKLESSQHYSFIEEALVQMNKTNAKLLRQMDELYEQSKEDQDAPRG